jgi:hypothetical protein
MAGGMDSQRSIGTAADSPFAESAMISARAVPVISSPSTSGTRTRVHAVAAPVFRPKPPSVNRHSIASPYPQPLIAGSGSPATSAGSGGVTTGGGGPAAMCQPRATTAVLPSTIIRASASEVSRPGLTGETSTVHSRRGIGPRKSTAMRVSRRSPPGAITWASRAAGGPPCCIPVSHGLSVARVGANRPPPRGR